LFGYFNPRNSKSYCAIRPKYRCCYCSTCKALEYNYGYLSKQLLSYDVALLAVILNVDTSATKVSRFPGPLYCGSFNSVKSNDDWKKIAALNLLLVATKLNDDILDDNSTLAKILFSAYGRTFKRAASDYPLMAKAISGGFLRIVEDEEQNADVQKISSDFADMMVLAVSSCMDVTDQQKRFISSISAWIYIIDALDDYDKDSTKGSFNPFVENGVRYKDYLKLKKESISELLESIFVNCLTYDDSQFDYISAEILLNQFIPDVNRIVLSGTSLKLVQLKATFCERITCSQRKEF